MIEFLFYFQIFFLSSDIWLVWRNSPWVPLWDTVFISEHLPQPTCLTIFSNLILPNQFNWLPVVVVDFIRNELLKELDAIYSIYSQDDTVKVINATNLYSKLLQENKTIIDENQPKNKTLDSDSVQYQVYGGDTHYK